MLSSTLDTLLKTLTIDISDDVVLAIDIPSFDSLPGLLEVVVPNVDTVASSMAGINGIGACSVSFGSNIVEGFVDAVSLLSCSAKYDVSTC